MGSIVGIIPARYASTRFPGKPLAEIGGWSMIRHVYERACRSSLKEILVATDDQRIFDEVVKFGGEVMMTDPHHQSGTDRLAEVAKRLSAADVIVNIQGDEPLISPDAIDAVITPMEIDSQLVMSSAMTALPDPTAAADPNIVKVVTDQHGYALYFSRAPIPHPRDKVAIGPWKKHLGLYCYRRDFLLKFADMRQTPLEKIEKLEQLRALESGYRIKMVECPEDSSIGVDTPEDLERVRAIIEAKLADHSKF